MSKFQGNKFDPTRFHRSQVKFYLFLVPMSVFMILPILYILNTAFKPMEELFKYPPAFFVSNPTLSNFKALFDYMGNSNIPVTRYIINSVISTAAVMLLSIVFSVCAAYILSKKKFRGRKILFEINTLALMFVATAVIIPRFIIIVGVGIYDSLWAHIFPLIAIPIGLFLLKQFIDQIPDAIFDAAKIDGASDYRIIIKIIFPMLKAPIATVAIMSFNSSWGNVDSSNLYITDESKKTFAYLMSSFTSANMSAAGQGISGASTLIMFLPSLIIFLIMQGKVMTTMAHSGIK